MNSTATLKRLAVIDSLRNDALRTIQRLQRYIGQGCILTAQQRADLDNAIKTHQELTRREWAILDGVR